MVQAPRSGSMVSGTTRWRSYPVLNDKLFEETKRDTCLDATGRVSRSQVIPSTTPQKGSACQC
jgi:hypothetical protein